MKKYILSIDQGTTSSRIVLYNLKFQVLDIIQKEFKQYFPKDGWVEHDAMEIWLDVRNLIKKILKKNKINSSNITSIGITNQRETTILWNKKTGKPVNKAIVWQDRRTAVFCKKLKGKYKLKYKSKKKNGFDPVTNIDGALELFLRKEITKRFPKDGIIGEEFKTKKTKNGFTWVIDPIDGTRSFIIGSPTWSNLISINYKNIPIFGLVNFPMLKKYYITGVNRASY